MPSRSHSPAYASSVSPSRASLRASAGSGYGPPVVAEPKPLSSIFSTTLPSAAHRTGSTSGGGAGSASPYSTQRNSPAALRRMGSSTSRSGSGSRNTSPYQAGAASAGRMGSPLTMVDGVTPPLTKQPSHSSSPVRASMTAVPQHYSSTLPRSLMHSTDPYGPQSYDVYERMARPNSLTGAALDAHTHTHTLPLFSRVLIKAQLAKLPLVIACFHVVQGGLDNDSQCGLKIPQRKHSAAILVI